MDIEIIPADNTKQLMSRQRFFLQGEQNEVD